MVGILLVLTLLLVAVFVYLGSGYKADAAAVEALVPEGAVTVTQGEDGMAFLPQDPKTGLIFYPGGKVEFTAYVPLMKALAARGVLCVLPEMPFDLAVLDINAADGICALYPAVEHWYIGGHSLGGSMAAAYLEKHPQDFAGLLLLASYSTADLSGTELSVLSIYGSEDGVMDRENYAENKANLPADFTECVLEGGNHAGFGMYGVQKGDGIATLTQERQILLTADRFAAFLTEKGHL